MFSIPPIGFTFVRWNDYWKPKLPDISTSKIDKVDKVYYLNQDNAWFDCRNRAIEYFDSDQIGSYALNVNGDYEAYDCYGVKYTKIP